MRNIALSFLLCLAMTVAAVSVFAGPATVSESGWFDYENCEFCKTLLEDPGLLAHSTWENFSIKNGAMNVMTVEPEYAAAMRTAEGKMSALGNKIGSGEVNPMTLKMCGHCMSFGMMMMGGAQMERIESDVAVITLMTSDNPDMVKRLQEQAKRDTKEMALLKHQH
ncbi:MAG: hypothetical protein GY780_12730 [bacterium]|nr:hypothetical protein [bacterium]